jgi:Trimethylamine methyltransferase (MTTB)
LISFSPVTSSRTHFPDASADIKRKIPTYELCSEEELGAIDAPALRILESIGFEIRGDEAALRSKAGSRRQAGFPILPILSFRHSQPFLRNRQ